MIFTMDGLRGFGLRAQDGDIGHIHDLLFDDDGWCLRYFVVDTRLLFGRRVLLPPAAFEAVDLPRHELVVALTKDRIRNSPDVDADKPVSRQQEVGLFGYYGWTPYWGVAGAGGYLPPMAPRVEPPVTTSLDAEMHPPADIHLRSAREVTGYTAHASDGDIGDISDFLIDQEGWMVRFLVVDTGRWLPGKKVIVAPQWADSVDWPDRSVHLRLTREQVRGAPPYDPDMAVDRYYEQQVFGYYRQAPYW